MSTLKDGEIPKWKWVCQCCGTFYKEDEKPFYCKECGKPGEESIVAVPEDKKEGESDESEQSTPT